MSLWTYGALLYEWRERNKPPSEDDAPADDGAPQPTAQQFDAFRDRLAALNMPDAKV